jgi:hypothetical protein
LSPRISVAQLTFARIRIAFYGPRETETVAIGRSLTRGGISGQDNFYFQSGDRRELSCYIDRVSRSPAFTVGGLSHAPFRQSEIFLASMNRRLPFISGRSDYLG